MCQYEQCKGEYAKAYAASESVVVELLARCQKCANPLPMKAESFVHFGGERWDAEMTCDCGATLTITVHPKTMFLRRK
jgi:hypothetical protein